MADKSQPDPAEPDKPDNRTTSEPDNLEPEPVNLNPTQQMILDNLKELPGAYLQMRQDHKLLAYVQSQGRFYQEALSVQLNHGADFQAAQEVARDMVLLPTEADEEFLREAQPELFEEDPGLPDPAEQEARLRHFRQNPPTILPPE